MHVLQKKMLRNLKTAFLVWARNAPQIYVSRLLSHCGLPAPVLPACAVEICLYLSPFSVPRNSAMILGIRRREHHTAPPRGRLATGAASGTCMCNPTLKVDDEAVRHWASQRHGVEEVPAQMLHDVAVRARGGGAINSSRFGHRLGNCRKRQHLADKRVVPRYNGSLWVKRWSGAGLTNPIPSRLALGLNVGCGWRVLVAVPLLHRSLAFQTGQDRRLSFRTQGGQSEAESVNCQEKPRRLLQVCTLRKSQK